MTGRMTGRKDRDHYWKQNRRLIGILLTLWFVVSFGFGILLAEPTESWRIGRLPAGFWWAQQGAMMVFVVLVFAYARLMDRLDRQHGVDEERPNP